MQRYSLKLFTQAEIIIDTCYFFHYMKGYGWLSEMDLLNLQDVLDLNMP